MMQLLQRFTGHDSTAPTFSTGTTPTFPKKLTLVPIVREPPIAIAAKWFVSDLQTRGTVGEFLWRDLVELYDVHAEEEGLPPLSPLMRSLFAQQLALLCQRGQVRVTENGRRRRLTTYTVPPAELAAA